MTLHKAADAGPPAPAISSPPAAVLPFVLRHVVLPAIERCTRSRFWSHYRQAVRFDQMPDSARRMLRDERLVELWGTALATLFFRQRLEQAGLGLEAPAPAHALTCLNSLSPVDKEAIRRHFPAGVTAPGAAGDWRWVSTAGTTDRMTVVADFAKRDLGRSSALRTLQIAIGGDVAVRTVAIPPNACNVLCGLEREAPPSILGYLWHALRRGHLFTAESRADLRGRFERRVLHDWHTLPPIEPTAPAQLAATLDQYIGKLAKLRPAHLRGFPVYLVWLADRLRNTGRRLEALRLVSPYGGLTSPRMRERITAGIGAPFADLYGTSELGPVAASCGESPGMHVFEDLFVLEVLRHGKSVEAGAVGRLVVTDLANHAMPLIRYDVGDVGRLLTGQCPCGRSTARLEVLGRVQETLDAPTGVLTASDVADTFFADPAVANFRLEEVAPASFETAVVASTSGGSPDLPAWQERFAALHGGVRRVKVRLAPFVRPEASGKYRFVRPFQSEREVL